MELGRFCFALFNLFVCPFQPRWLGHLPCRGSLLECNPPQNLQVFLQILNPVNNAAILAPELVGGQSEMVG